MTDVPDDPPSSYSLRRKPLRPQSEFEQSVRRIATTPYPVLLLSAMNVAALAKARKAVIGYPTVISCIGHAGIFAASAYALGTGDTTNGPGLATGWSINWLIFNARKAVKSKRLVPISMTSLVATIGSIYGFQYFTGGRE
ncbi:hypothetical protein IWW50_000055 [Coemansia erecta]|nr:hypothetical protein GGF43_000176 [Coemansia sp. RSA 2618]KAJ2830834.1 hypothetical protein IWW50_000055 [Coemansia erecta]